MAAYVTNLQSHKVEAVEALKNKFEGVNGYIFTDYRGLTVEQITELRNKLREQGAELKVIKNRFAKIVFKNMQYPHGVAGYLIGPTAVALTKEEAGPTAKILLDFAEDAPLDIKGGIIEGQILDAAQVKDFSKLPTKKELIAMLMSTMNAPLQNFVYVINGVTTKLVRTLQAVADKQAVSK